MVTEQADLVKETEINLYESDSDLQFSPPPSCKIHLEHQGRLNITR